jgi:hypothetical protein
MRRTFTLLGVTAAAVATCSAATAASPPIPTLPSPAEFVHAVNNQWFPLRPGTVFTYQGVKDGKAARDVLSVTNLKRTLAGIHATVLHDRLYLNGRLEERTTDWYAQDKVGNVWYLGEDTAVLDTHGRVTSTEGSWRVGEHGARAGIYMLAHPRKGDAARQEFFKGHAEDQFRVLSSSARVNTPAASSTHALLTQETTRLEPGVVDHKLYVRGVGAVREEAVRGGAERLVMTSIKRP